MPDDRRHTVPTWDSRALDGLGPLLAPEFFGRDTELVARELPGKMLLSDVDGVVTGGRIVETEAYLGSDDPGSHAATRGITERNRVMYGPPGIAYVYFTYGMHHMVNLVTEAEGTAGAVLVRAIEPSLGLDAMTARRLGRGRRDLADGPAKLAQALGVTLADNGARLGVGHLAVFEAPAPEEAVLESGRIGLTAGHELPLRFYLEGSAHSRARTGGTRRGGPRPRERHGTEPVEQVSTQERAPRGLGSERTGT
jgi:DNA-3-methyladenine glycosylase